MDLLEMSSDGESPRTEKQLQNTYLTPFTKESQANTTIPTKKPQKKCLTVRYAVNASDFRSMVQRLTGLRQRRAISPPIEDIEAGSVEDFESVAAKNKIAIEIKAYSDMKQCLGSLRSSENLADFPEDLFVECLDCLAYCSLFTDDYEIERDTLVQLWMAAGLVQDEPMEDIGAAYITALHEFGDIISLSREDYATGKLWYKVHGSKLSLQVLEMSRISLLRVDSDDPVSVISCHVSFGHLPMNLEVVGRCAYMKSLLLLHVRDQKLNINCVPYDFFLWPELIIQALDLSRTKVSELPSSIGNAKCLRYIDLSNTLIRRLPETVDSLQSLQTLKLQNCPCLIALPKGMRRLATLRHLDLGTNCRLPSMPLGMGALSSLCTLSHFVAGYANGCQIGELKNMNSLRGKLCLSRLDRVACREEAKQASLSNKHRLTKLELRWADNIEQESNRDDQEVIEHLQPPTSLQDLRILCYGGSTFPSWISDPSFVKLVTITIFKCDNCQLLPSLGQLPSLESLSLIELAGVRIIDSSFCGNITTGDEHQLAAFPSLQKLTIKSMVGLEEWRDMGKHDFPQLKELKVSHCPELARICRLSDLQFLKHLEINHCAKLPCLPGGDFPTSLKTLVIEDCPLLSLSSLLEDAKDWLVTEHHPNIFVYECHEENQGC